jgi:hypothetical protein
VAGHELIEEQLQLLRRRLPADMVDEITDGLQETYQAQLQRTPDPATAARCTIVAFGDADIIARAHCVSAAWRRSATTLLVLGPFVGGLWAVALIGQQAWIWAVPGPIRILTGVVLLCIVGLLLIAHREQRNYRRGRLASLTASTALILLDAAICCATLHHLTPSGPVVLAALGASLLRATAVSTVTARQLLFLPH